MNKPLINCIIETDKENTYFKFVKVDEVIRNKDNIYNKNIGTFNGYIIRSYVYPYFIDKNIYIFGCMKEYDNDIISCNKEVILALEEAGCEIIIKECIPELKIEKISIIKGNGPSEVKLHTNFPNPFGNEEGGNLVLSFEGSTTEISEYVMKYFRINPRILDLHEESPEWKEYNDE